MMDVREEDEDYQNPVDQIFERLQKIDPQHFAVRQYTKFKMAAGRLNCNRKNIRADIFFVNHLTDSLSCVILFLKLRFHHNFIQSQFGSESFGLGGSSVKFRHNRHYRN